MTATTAMTVMTPMMTPRSVRNERSLCAVTAFQATRRSSPTSMAVSGLLRGVRRGGRVVDFHAVADLELAERLERAGDDLLAVRDALDDFRLEVRVDPRLDLAELDRPVLLDEEDALDVLLLLGGARRRRGRSRGGRGRDRGTGGRRFLLGGLLRALERSRVGDDERRDRDRERRFAAVGLDLPGDREAGADVFRRVRDLHLDLEVHGGGVGPERGLRDRAAADLGHDALEFLLGIGVEREARLLPELHVRDVGLVDLHLAFDERHVRDRQENRAGVVHGADDRVLALLDGL